MHDQFKTESVIGMGQNMHPNRVMVQNMDISLALITKMSVPVVVYTWLWR